MPFYSFFAEHDKDGSVAYTFETKTTTGYRVYFYPAKDYSEYVLPYKLLSEFGYICGITKLEPNELKVEPFDCAIKSTIKLIFIDFFKEFGEESILLYHCDYYDGKQEKRNNIFKLWYYELKDTHDVYMEATDITAIDENGTPILTNYLGFFIIQSNPNIEAIQQEFHSVKENLISEK